MKSSMLQQGDSSDDVKLLQQSLSEHYLPAEAFSFSWRFLHFMVARRRLLAAVILFKRTISDSSGVSRTSDFLCVLAHS